MLAVLIGLSALSYTLLERPLQRRLRRLGKAPQPVMEQAGWFPSPHAAPMQDQHVVGAAQSGTSLSKAKGTDLLNPTIPCALCEFQFEPERPFVA